MTFYCTKSFPTYGFLQFGIIPSYFLTLTKHNKTFSCMKRNIILLCLFAITLVAKGQDKLVTTNGEVIEAYQVDIGNSAIYYKKSNVADAPLVSISKEQILMIKKMDGTVVKLYERSSVQQEAKTPIASSSSSEPENTAVTFSDLSSSLQQSNRGKMALLNQDIDVVKKDEVKGKRAKLAFMFWGIKENSVLENEDIEISAVLGSFFKMKAKDPYKFLAKDYGYTPAIQFMVRNKLSRTIYLDLGNTFYTMLGQPTCFYIPSSTTTSTSSYTGGSVNLGSVAGAVGIGGAVGQLANGVNVGGASTNGTSNTTYSQRVIAIPPMATKILEPQFMYGATERELCTGARVTAYSSFVSYLPIFKINYDKNNDRALKDGEKASYNEENSPINFSFMVSYSMTENCQIEKNITANYYLKDMIGLRINLMTGIKKIDFNSKNREALMLNYAGVSDSYPDSFPRY